MDITAQMTEITRYMFEKATSEQINLRRAVEQLKTDANIRTVRETLARAVGKNADDIKGLQTFLTERLLESAPDAKRDSVERKVRMWLKDDCLTVSKQGAIQLGFALGLGVEGTNELLIKLSGEGFHWRDPEEIVYIHGLLAQMSYTETCELYLRMSKAGVISKAKEGEPLTYTEQVKETVSRISDEAELEDYLRSAGGELGKLHNTAYTLFMGFLSLLGLPVLEDELPDVRSLSMRDVLNEYMHDRFIPRMKRAGREAEDSEKLLLSALQRDIRQNWPDETTLSKMVHRETDVNRKVLILLFLATDGGESDYGDMLLDDLSPDDAFKDRYERMNNMLSDCGFGGLDSRTPFDWMILYCMCADDTVFIDGRVRRFLSKIFPETEAAEQLEAHAARRK